MTLRETRHVQFRIASPYGMIPQTQKQVKGKNTALANTAII